MVVTDFATAQLVKVAANAFLATKISFINAMAEVCEATGGDVTLLCKALSYDTRIGGRFLHAGLGFGGGCLPKDIRAFMARAGELGVDQALSFLKEVDAINLRRRARMVDLAREQRRRQSFGGMRVAVLGAAFKPNSDDIRDSPALDVAASIQKQGAAVSLYDPEAMDNARVKHPELGYRDTAVEAARGADIVLHLTEWAEFREMDPAVLSEVVAEQAHRRRPQRPGPRAVARRRLDLPRPRPPLTPHGGRRAAGPLRPRARTATGRCGRRTCSRRSPPTRRSTATARAVSSPSSRPRWRGVLGTARGGVRPERDDGAAGRPAGARRAAGPAHRAVPPRVPPRPARGRARSSGCTAWSAGPSATATGCSPLDDLQAVAEPPAALVLELPQRDLGGQLPGLGRPAAQTAWARERGAAVHLDGARLWEASAGYGRPPAEVAALFDTAYVSFYKGLGALAGCCLAGPEDVVAEVREWRQRMGGTLFGMWPGAASALHVPAPRGCPGMPAYLERARALADARARRSRA